MKKLLLAVGVVSMLATMAEAKTAGLWYDGRTRNICGITNSLVQAGWEVKIITGNMENAEMLKKLDVLIFSNGHNGYYFPTPMSRRQIVRAAAAGLGVVSLGFRNGYVRTANRPMFPTFGVMYNRVGSPWMTAEPDTPFTDLFEGRALAFAGHDHMVMKPGPDGKIFARSGGDVTGSYGDFHFGRVVVFGGHFLFNPGDPIEEDCKRVLLGFVDWAKRSKSPSEAEAKKVADEEEDKLLRREVVYDWTLDDRGPDRTAGFLPFSRDHLLGVIEPVAFKLEYYAGFLSDSEAKKCRELASKIKEGTEAVKRACEEDKQQVLAAIEKASGETILAWYNKKSAPIDKAAAEKKYSSLLDNAAVEAGKKLIAEMKPKVRAAKDAAIEAEWKEDLKTVPALIKAMTDKDAKKRLWAATEIGRISPDDDDAVEALIDALEDKVEEVRTQAAISLGWMRAEDAVKPLLKRLKSDNVFDRRRAAQALGAIGDDDAVSSLVAAYAKDGDIEFKKIVLLALGWIKAKDQVPFLLEVLNDDKAVMELRELAAIALGYIGDERAVETLDRLAKADKWSFRGNSYSPCILGGDLHGLYKPCSRALKMIKDGGRKTRGIVQDPDARSKKVFYRLTKECNAFAARIEEMGSNKNFAGAEGQKRLLAYSVDAGFTGIHNAWGQHRMPEDGFAELVEEADDLGLMWIDVMPVGGAGGCKARKSGFELPLERFEQVSSWQGFWSEETWPLLEYTMGDLDNFLKEKFGADYRKTMKLRDDEIAILEKKDMKIGAFRFDAKADAKTYFSLDYEKMAGSDRFKRPLDGILRTETLELGAKIMDDEWKENQDFLHGRRKACACTYSFSTADPVQFIGGNKALRRYDTIGAESYQCFGRGSAFLIKKWQDGETVPAMSEYYHWYCPSNVHALRGYWQNMIHGKCFYNFTISQIFDQPSANYLWLWERGRWGAAKEVFNRVRDNAEWYSVVPAKVNIAVMGSERSAAASREQVYAQMAYPIRYDENMLATWTSLNQAHLPANILYAEGITAEKLAQYDVICLADAKMLAPEECEVLKAWVKDGGILICEGTTSLFDPYRAQVALDNYRLADLFGADYVKSEFREGTDTIAFRPPFSTSYPVKLGFSEVWHFEDWIHRDVKPKKSIMTAKDIDGLTVEYDAALGYDQVKPTTAKVIATMENGDPAILENVYGKGRCYFQTSHFPQFGFVCSEWEMMPSRFAFWPGVHEMLEKLVRNGMKAKGVKEAVSFEGLSPEVETTPEDRGKFMTVHLLDYDVKSMHVKGPLMTVNDSRKVKRAFYPDTKTEAKVDGNKVQLRDFNTYDLVVVEFE